MTSDKPERPEDGQGSEHGPDERRPADKAWFGPKRVGFGWSPRRWQGWVVILLVVAAVVIFRLVAGGHLFR